MKNAISRNPEGFEQPYLDASFATTGYELTVSEYTVENFKFGYFLFISKFFLEFF